MPLLLVRNLTLSLGDRTLLDNLSFSLETGECVGLVGPNGAGKTTLLRLIAGELLPDSGLVRTTCALGFLRQEQRAADALSGGERTRAALDAVLAQQPGLLLLDEPTNHLDARNIAYLLQRLQALRAATLVVSHDRYFLDAVADRILELADGRLTEYAGGYSDYRAQKAQRYAEQLHQYEVGQRRQRALEEDIAALRQRAQTAHRKSTEAPSSGLKMGEKEKRRASAKKMDKKVKNDIRRLERMREDAPERPKAERRVRFEIEGQSAHSRRILEAKDLGKRFGAHALFTGASFALRGGDRVALFGENGAGKTTLLRMIAGEEPFEGELWVSPSARPCLIRQDFAFTDTEQTVLALLQAELGTVGGAERRLLNNLGLTSRQLAQPARALSFGEQMKCKLAMAILRQEDFLLLDEPTNHLDLPAREQLEETLASYNGTLLIASHDLYLLRRLCTSVLDLRGGALRLVQQDFARFAEESLGL